MRCCSVISTKTVVSVRAGSWPRTSWRVPRLARWRVAFDQLDRPARELLDLRLPLILHRCRRDDEDALDAALAGHQLGGGQRLHGLAQAHVVAKDGPPPTGGEQHAAHL